MNNVASAQQARDSPLTLSISTVDRYPSFFTRKCPSAFFTHYCMSNREGRGQHFAFLSLFLKHQLKRSFFHCAWPNSEGNLYAHCFVVLHS